MYMFFVRYFYYIFYLNKEIVKYTYVFVLGDLFIVYFILKKIMKRSSVSHVKYIICF